MGKWDSFEDEAKAGSGYNFTQCGMGDLLDRIGNVARTSIEAALARPDITSTAILKTLKARVDTDISDFTVRRHRGGKCSCAKRSSSSAG